MVANLSVWGTQLPTSLDELRVAHCHISAHMVLFGFLCVDNDKSIKWVRCLWITGKCHMCVLPILGWLHNEMRVTATFRDRRKSVWINEWWKTICVIIYLEYYKKYNFDSQLPTKLGWFVFLFVCLIYRCVDTFVFCSDENWKT